MSVSSSSARNAVIYLVMVCAVGCNRATSADLKPYTQCTFGDEFQIFRVDGPVRDIAWPTPTKNGNVSIKVDVGYRVLITYLNDEAFANLKVEQLPKPTYKKEKADILESLKYFAADPGNDGKVRSETRNGFAVYGINRNKLAGGVLSIYNLFQDDAEVAVTMYLLNDDPKTRKFDTLEKYASIRDKFLDAYTACVAKNLQGKAATVISL